MTPEPEYATRRYAISVVVVLTVVFAGCNAFVGSGNDASGATSLEPVTPAPVPTDSPTPAPRPSDVPGLSRAGVVDGGALLDAHVDALRGRSFGVRTLTRDELTNGTVVNRTRTWGRVGQNGRVYIRSVRGATGNASAGGNSENATVQSEVWVGDGRSLRAITDAHKTKEFRQLPEILRVKRGLTRDTIGVLASLDPRTSRVLGRVRVNGTTLYRIEGQTPWLNGTNATHVALVGTDGRVRTLRTTRPAVRKQNVSTTVFELRYMGVGTTSVEHPSWYDAAIQNTTGARPRTHENMTLQATTARATTTRATKTRSGDTLAPGLTPEGVVNASALASAHADTLDGTSFTYRSNVTERYANGTHVERTQTGRFGANEHHYFAASNTHVTPNLAGPTPRDIWTNGQRILTATTTANGTSYGLLGSQYNHPASDFDRPAVLGFDPSMQRGLRALFDSVGVSVTNGSTPDTYRLDGTAGDTGTLRNVTTHTASRSPSVSTALNPLSVSTPASVSLASALGVGSVRAVSLRAVATSNGFIRRFEVEYAATTQAGVAVTGTMVVAYTAIGSTSVGRPSWYGAAMENTTARRSVRVPEPAPKR